MKTYLSIIMLLMGLGSVSSSEAATLPSGFSESTIASGLNRPTAMELSPDGRIFVTEQDGALRVIKNGSLLPTPFLRVTVSSSGERGLLGVTLDPLFPSRPYVYVYYTATTPAIHNRISRFTAQGDVAEPGSEVTILDLNNLGSATNHNGGALHFGDDGKLYIATGENAQTSHAQNFNNLLGKILRINPDGTIPTDNPFYNQTSGQNKAIWALGLRNPFTFSFNPADNRMFINDVGRNTWEEINEGKPGANFGWPATEGYTSDSRYSTPVYAYDHSSGGCAITGGSFYSPASVQFPSSYRGIYFFGDYCGGWIKSYHPSTDAVQLFASGVGQLVDLRVDDAGYLYYLTRSGGILRRIRYGSNTPPSITQHPQNLLVSEGRSATFSCAASGSPTITYQWQRDLQNIPGATGSQYTLTLAQLTDSGSKFRCIATNSFGSAASNEATLTVTTNQAPTARIVEPSSTRQFRPGETIFFEGTGTDPEDGTLPSTAFEWKVDFHHETHVHPFMPTTTGIKSGSFTIPTEGETSRHVWYRIYLTVQDSKGRKHITQRDIFPAPLDTPATLISGDAQIKNGGVAVTGGWEFKEGQSLGDYFKFRTGGSLTVTVNARSIKTETQWPRLVLYVDQRRVTSVGTNSTSFKDYNLKTTITAGSHLISLGMAEDSSTDSDRGLIISRFSVPQAVPFSVKINFQNSDSPTPSGYVKDVGAIYGGRGNGLTFGWNVEHESFARYRRNSISPDLRYDTLNHMQYDDGAQAWTWKIRVPNGTYQVKIVAGDPSFYNSTMHITAEGKTVVHGNTTSSQRWLTGTTLVSVTDGILHLGNGTGAKSNKICFIEINQTQLSEETRIDTESENSTEDSLSPEVQSDEENILN